jgi:hypothetical protein
MTRDERAMRIAVENSRKRLAMALWAVSTAAVDMQRVCTDRLAWEDGLGVVLVLREHVNEHAKDVYASS